MLNKPKWLQIIGFDPFSNHISYKIVRIFDRKFLVLYFISCTVRMYNPTILLTVQLTKSENCRSFPC